MRHVWGEFGRINTHCRIGIIQQVDEFIVDVAVVNIDVGQTGFKSSGQTLEIFRSITHINCDLVIRLGAIGQHISREIITSSDELRPGHHSVTMNQCGPVTWDYIAHRIENVTIVPRYRHTVSLLIQLV